MVLVCGGGAAAVLVVAVASAALLLATAPGHRALRDYAVKMLAGAVDGTVTIGEVGGALWRAADLRHIELRTADGLPAIKAERLSAVFAITDLVRGRFRFSRVTLVRPVIVLEQGEDGHWNIERLFKLVDADTTSPGPRPLVDLRDVAIADGTLILRTRPERGVRTQRTFTGLTASLARLRASHPDSTALLASLRRLAVRVDEPALVLQDAHGELALDGDSLRFELEHVTLPRSHIDATGILRLGGERPALDANVNATRLAFADLRGLAADLPADGTGRAAFRVRLSAEGGGSVDIQNAELRTGRSAAQARGLVAFGARGGVSLRGLDALLHPLDLALLAPFVDSLPVRGLVSGRLRASGAVGDLALDAALDWSDEATAGAPHNTFDGRGRLAFGGAAGLVFRAFTARRVDLDLGTLRHFAPSLELAGRLRIAGTLEGPWQDARFAGAIEHAGPGLASALRGTVRLGLRDTLHVDAELTVDSLSFALLRLSYPDIPLRDMMRGRVALHGPLTALTVDAVLSGAPGALAARGRLGIGDSLVTLTMSGSFDSLDVQRLAEAAPPTALWGRWIADLRVPLDTLDPLTGTARLDLRTGRIAGVAFGEGSAPLRLDRDRVEVDGARFSFAGGSASLSGALGRRGRDADAQFTVRSDTLGYLEPLLRWARQASGDSSAVVLDGAGLVTGRIRGITDAWAADAEFSVAAVEAAGGVAQGLRGRGRLAGGAHGFALSVRVEADRVAAGGLSYAPVDVTLSGPLDSLAIRARGGFLASSSVYAEATIWGDSALRLVRVDSLDLSLPLHAWRLQRPVTARIEPHAVTFDTLELRPGVGVGLVRARGALPRRGEADFFLAADSVPVTDLYAIAQRDTSGINGAMNGTVRVTGPAEAPTIELRVALSDGHFGDYRLPLFQMLARYTERRLTLKGGLWRDDQRIVAINGSVPVDLSLQAVAERRLPGDLVIVAEADTLDMQVLDPLTDVVRQTSGRMGVNVRIGGSWERTRLSGFVDISDGAMTVPALGARYTGMDARLELADSTVRIARARLRGGNGTLDVSGSAVFAELGRPRLDLTLRFARFAAFAVPEFGAFTGSGTLRLRGQFPVDTVTGAITVDAGYLKFADLVQKRIVSLDDPEFRALVDSNLARAADFGPDVQTVFLDSLRIDSVAVIMGNDVWLRSSEANIQLAGDFVVGRRIESGLPRYRLDGTMRAVRGNYKLALGAENSFLALTKDFRVSRGTVRFFGTPDFNPEMDIVAENIVRTVQGQPLTVRAVIGGTLLYPRLTLESDQRPPLSQTEIISYLILGRPPSQVSGSELGVVQSYAGGLLGGVGQALVSELGLPLSYLTIVPGGSANNAQTGVNAGRIEAGVQLSQRTFLTLNAGLCEVLTSPLPGATLEYRLSRRWTASTSFEPVVQTCGTAASLAGFTTRFQLGFDLFWQQGIR